MPKKEMSRTATYCNVHIEIVSGADKSIFLDTRPNFYLFCSPAVSIIFSLKLRNHTKEQICFIDQGI
jgi:hypothetical protein